MSDLETERISTVSEPSLEWKVFSLARNVFVVAGIYCFDDLALAVTGYLPVVGSQEFYPPPGANAPPRVDRRGLYKLFELAVALEFHVLPWECVSPEVLVAAGARRNKNNGALPDCGVDCASADLRTQLQAKWYRPGGRVPFTAVGTFGMYAEHLGATERILVSSPNVKFSYPAGNIRSIRYETLTPERVVELLAPAFNFDFRLHLDGEDEVEIATRLPGDETSVLKRSDVFCPQISKEKNETLLMSPPSDAKTSLAPFLRPYQQEALGRIRDACAEGGVHSVVMACGTGKTVIIARLVHVLLSETHKSEICRFAILVPSLQLVSRFTDELAIWAPAVEYEVVKGGVEPKFDKSLLICVNNSAKKIAKHDFEVVVVDEAHHIQGWDPEEEDVSEESENDSERTGWEFSDEEFSEDEGNENDEDESDWESLSSTPSFSPASSPDLSSADEAKTKRGFLNVAARLKCKTRLDFTATPKSVRTPCVSLGLREAIEAGILVDYWIDVPVFENNDTPEQKSANRKPNLARLVAEHPEWSRVLAYCNTVAEAEIFAGLLCERGVPAISFSGKTPVSERERLIRSFEDGEFRALVTVNVLGEGVDIPCADCCLFVEPRGSKINVIQCIGRVLRKAPGKTRSVVVLPTTESEEHAVLRRFFAIILGEDRVYSEWRTGVSSGSESRGRVELNFSCGETLSQNSEHLEEEQAKLLREDVFSRLGEALVDAWNIKLKVLQAFVAEFSRAPKTVETFRGESLGKWCSHQREAYKKGKLSADRIAQLEAIEYWNWGSVREEKKGTPEEIWKNKIELLQIFTGEKSRVPKLFEKFRGESLGKWCSHQREAYKKGKLSADRIAQLEAIEYWNWGVIVIREKRGTPEEIWKSKIELLQIFTAEMSRTPKQGESLGNWCSNQRQAYKKGKLSADRIAQLEAIEYWNWGDTREKKGTPEEIWKNNIKLLQTFTAEMSRTPKDGEKFRGESLGNWCSHQRQVYKKEKLSADRIMQLEAIEYWKWSVIREETPEEIWKSKIELLQTFTAEMSRTPKDKEKFRGESLGSWCGNQRQAYKKGKLSADRIAQLEAIEYWNWSKKIL